MKSKGIRLLGDKGYKGSKIILSPIKNPRKTKKTPQPPSLSFGEKTFNLNVRGRRVKVENVIGRMKRFKCLKTEWRHAIEKHALVTRVVAKLTNIHLIDQPLGY